MRSRADHVDRVRAGSKFSPQDAAAELDEQLHQELDAQLEQEAVCVCKCLSNEPRRALPCARNSHTRVACMHVCSVSALPLSDTPE